MNNNYLRKSIFALRDALWPVMDEVSANRLIADKIQEGQLMMVARFGAVEIKGVLYGTLPPPINLIVKGYCERHMHNNAGFFPVDKPNVKQFARLMKESMKQLDILASWRPEEMLFARILHGIPRMQIGSLSPIGKDYSYTRALKGKKVLVVHPYADTIERQYHDNRKNLFDDKEFLPEFASLQTVKAVQTIAGNTAGYNSWFEALEDMERQISTKDFDIALLGCGAYGFPLAAYIKSLGKQAIHMGGQLQLLFGIKGKRWDGAWFYNKYWVRPSENERPQNLRNVEDGAYW